MEITLDPTIKQQIKDGLYDYLYKPVLAQAKQRLSGIIQQNCMLLNSPHESFIYKGTVYVTEDNVRLPRQMNRLHLSLYPAMEDHLTELRKLNEEEMPYVLGFINQVLNSSNDLHDYLRILPPSIHQPIQELIASCPCRTVKLSNETVEQLQKKNEHSILLIKKRQVINLLL